MSNWSTKIIQVEFAASSDLKTILGQKTTKKKMSAPEVRIPQEDFSFNNVNNGDRIGSYLQSCNVLRPI